MANNRNITIFTGEQGFEMYNLAMLKTVYSIHNENLFKNNKLDNNTYSSLRQMLNSNCFDDVSLGIDIIDNLRL